MTLLEAGPSVGGLVAGWKTKGGKSIEAGAWVGGRVDGFGLSPGFRGLCVSWRATD